MRGKAKGLISQGGDKTRGTTGRRTLITRSSEMEKEFEVSKGRAEVLHSTILQKLEGFPKLEAWRMLAGC